MTTDVLTEYNKTESLAETARRCGISQQKVRRILITNKIIPQNPQTLRILELYDSGMSVKSIADKLKISQNAVRGHLPHQKKQNTTRIFPPKTRFESEKSEDRTKPTCKI